MFKLATPTVLLAIPLPLLIWFFLPKAKKYYRSALNIPFIQMISPEQKNRQTTSYLSVSWLYVIWLLTIFAASGPTWVGEPRSLQHEGYNIMLILDISGSMEIRDRIQFGRPITRLELVKSTAEKFVKHRSADHIGLILFGTRAYLQTPLTQDHATILNRLQDATVGLAGKTTAIGDALGLAIKHMQHLPKKGRVIILLTDGANNAGILLPLKAAQLAKQDDIKVYTIGLSSETNLPFFNAMPASALDDLDEETLKTIASMTHGRYFRATDKRSLEHIYQLINQLETVTADSATIRPEKAYYPYPLGIALCCLMLWLIRYILREQYR